MQPLGNLATMLIMERAKLELERNHDVTMTILLSAMAVEAQMSWLYLKWRAIDDGVLPSEENPAHREKWEAAWSEMRSISNRLDKLSCQLSNGCFDEFAQLNIKWLKDRLDGFDSATSIKAFFQDQIFEKRNRVVHYGNIDFEADDGKKCFSLALALLGLLKAMDNSKYSQKFPS